MVRPAAHSPSAFVFTEEHVSFLFFHSTIMQVECDALTKLFNRHFKTNLSEEILACRVWYGLES